MTYHINDITSKNKHQSRIDCLAKASGSLIRFTNQHGVKAAIDGSLVFYCSITNIRRRLWPPH